MNPAIIEQCKREIASFIEAFPDLADDPVLRADMLEGETDMAGLLSRIVRARGRAKADQAGAKAAKETIAAHYDRRMAVADHSEAACNRMITAILEAANLSKFAVPEGKISIVAGRNRLELAADFDPPQGYQIVRTDPDKAAIKAALEAGEAMPGASLVTSGPSVRVV